MIIKKVIILKVLKLHVTISVKISHSICNILFLKLSVPVFSQILTYLPAVEVPQLLSVDPLKSSIGLEFNLLCQPLPLSFNRHFPLTYVLEKCRQL